MLTSIVNIFFYFQLYKLTLININIIMNKHEININLHYEMVWK